MSTESLERLKLRARDGDIVAFKQIIDFIERRKDTQQALDLASEFAVYAEFHQSTWERLMEYCEDLVIDLQELKEDNESRKSTSPD